MLPTVRDLEVSLRRVLTEQDGETRQISSEELNYFASMQYARRIFIYTLVSYCAGCVLTLSLPIFLAQSSDPSSSAEYCEARTIVWDCSCKAAMG